jgi:hypothetical protein
MSAPTSPLPSRRHRVYPGLDQLVLRAFVVVGAMTAVVAAQAAGARPATWQQAVVLGLSLVMAVRPESLAGVGVMCAAAYTWSMAPETLSPLVLLAAGGMVLAHVCALLVAQGPARMHVDGAQVRRWAGRALLLWTGAAAVWGLGVAMADLPQRRTSYALGLVMLLVLAVATTSRLSARAGRRAGG